MCVCECAGRFGFVYGVQFLLCHRILSWRQADDAESIFQPAASLRLITCVVADTGIDELYPSSSSPCSSWPTASSSPLNLPHPSPSFYISSAPALASLLLLFSNPPCHVCNPVGSFNTHCVHRVCLLFLHVSMCGCVCVLVRIERLMPKRKFPEFCEGLLRQAGIKIVCVRVCGGLCWLQWWGEDDCILEKEIQLGGGLDTQSVSALSLVPALRLS